MSEILEVAARPGVGKALQGLVASNTTSYVRQSLADELLGHGVSGPEELIDELLGLHVLQQSAAGLLVSVYGRRVALLLEALEGGDLDDVFRRLRRLGGAGEPYKLVRQGMTTRFLESLNERPGFGRLYFCSPWINPSDREAALLKYAIMQAQKLGNPEVLVVTRPEEMQPDGIKVSGNGLKPFIDVGAKVHFLKKLHTKLYIREPDASGGYLMAIVGSENLTQSNNLELGVQINGDSRLITQLISHFYELTSYSSEDE